MVGSAPEINFSTGLTQSGLLPAVRMSVRILMNLQAAVIRPVHNKNLKIINENREKKNMTCVF